MNATEKVDKYNLDIIPSKSIIFPKNIPQELKKFKNWLCWGWLKNKGGTKWTKPPLDIFGKGFGDHVNKQCFSFKKAYQAYLDNHYISGIGYSFKKEDPFIGMDIDNCIKDGKLDKRVKKLLKMLNSYTEISPSGTGLRVIGFGNCKTVGATKKHNLEIYTEKRYLTLTGQVYKDYTKVRDIEKTAEIAVNFVLGKHTNGNSNGNKKIGHTIDRKRLKRASRESSRLLNNFNQDKGRLVSELNKIPNDSYDVWLKVGMGLHQSYQADEQALRLWGEWSAAGDYKEYSEEVCFEKWQTFNDDLNKDGITIFGLLKYFKETEDYEAENLDLGLEIDPAPFGSCKDVKPVAIEWLWDKRIPKGKVTVFSGMAGITKTTAALTILAAISTGTAFPLREGIPERGNVAIVSAEDGLKDTIIPRFILNGGNPKRLFNLDSTNESSNYLFDLSEERTFDELERFIRKDRIRAFVIDPLKAYLGTINENDTLRIRNVLAKLGKIAERTGCAIICITHFTKDSSNTNATLRVSGSSVYIEAARAVIAFVVEEVEGEKFFYMNTVKENLGSGRQTIRYEIESATIEGVDFEHPKLKFLGYDERSIDQILRDLFIREKEAKADVVTDGKAKAVLDKAFDYLQVERKQPVEFNKLKVALGRFSGRLRVKELFAKLEEVFLVEGIKKRRGSGRKYWLHLPECICSQCDKSAKPKKKESKKEKQKRLNEKVAFKYSKSLKKRRKK